MASQIPYLDVQNLTKRFGAQVLFDKISFSIAEGQKVGLVARNGTGKSTLMSVLMDKEGHESGDIIYRRDLKIGYLEQSPQFDPEESVLDACFNHEGDPEKVLRAKQILTQLHITNMEQPMGQLSGGQQKRVALANVLIEEPDFLMLDEPTNHLDLEMIEWLEGYLNRGNKTIFMVTHDRFFLDKVCNTILELDDKTIYTYRGNYAYYLEKRQERMDNLRAEIQHSKNLYRRELDWMRRQPQARGHKAKYREDAFYELEKVAKQRIEDRQVRLKASTVYIGSKIFECQYVSKAFDDRGKKKVILDNFYYNFARFEKMGIVGNNGTGKSTFIKMLLGEVQPDSGKFDIGETVRFGYFSQEGLKFKEDQKVTPAVQRYEMTCLAAEDNPHFRVTDMETRRPGNSYTAVTLRELKALRPEDSFYYIVGADTLVMMSMWKDPGAIFGACTILVETRQDEVGSEGLAEEAEKLRRTYGADIVFLPSRQIDLSSTEIRERVRTGKSIRYLVPDSVEQYIRREGLYLS